MKSFISIACLFAIWFAFVIGNANNPQDFDPETTNIDWELLEEEADAVARCEVCDPYEMIHTAQIFANTLAIKILSENQQNGTGPDFSVTRDIVIVNATDNLMFSARFVLSSSDGVFKAQIKTNPPGPTFENLNIAYPRTNEDGDLEPIEYFTSEEFLLAFCRIFPDIDHEDCDGIVPIAQQGVNIIDNFSQPSSGLVGVFTDHGNFRGHGVGDCICTVLYQGVDRHVFSCNTN